MIPLLISRSKVKDFPHILHKRVDQRFIEIRISKPIRMAIVTLAICPKVAIVVTLTGDEEVTVTADMGVNPCQCRSHAGW